MNVKNTSIKNSIIAVLSPEPKITGNTMTNTTKLDKFLFNKNVAIFKDNVRYQHLNTKMFSNKITINLLTRDIEISSKNKLDKVKVQKTN